MLSYVGGCRFYVLIYENFLVLTRLALNFVFSQFSNLSFYRSHGALEFVFSTYLFSAAHPAGTNRNWLSAGGFLTGDVVDVGFKLDGTKYGGKFGTWRRCSFD